jgi:hypothetical protein
MMRNLELPARMSPCLRLFVESLLDEVHEHRVAHRGSQKPDFQPALSRAIKRKELSEDRQHECSHFG